MSSTKSVRTLSSTDARDRLIEATARVCETSFFACAEPAPVEALVALAEEPTWYHAVVSFDGSSKGRVQVSLPEGLAHDMFAGFLGFSDSEAANTAEIETVTGEFANMVCGAWLTTMGGETCFALGHPLVHFGGLPAPEDDNIVLSVNERPAIVRAEFE